MDYVKKIVCLEGAKTRTQGLMPYYEFGTGSGNLVIADGPNGNWGQFVANPEFLSGKTYETMLHNYYSILNMVRSGVKLRKVEPKEGGIIFTEDIGGFTFGDCPSGGTGFIVGDEPDYFYEYAAYDAKDFYSQGMDSVREETKRIYRSEYDIPNTYIVLIEDYDKFTGLSKYLSGTTYKSDLARLNPVDVYSGDPHYEWERYCEVVDLCIGKINIPSRIYNEHIKVPKSMPCADVQPYIDWLSNYQALSADCCNARLWEDMGGKEMLKYLEQSAKTKCESYSEVINGLNYTVPYIEIPVHISQNYTDIGVLTNIDGVDYDESLSGQSADTDEITRPHGYLQFSTNDSGFTDGEEISAITISGKCLTIDEIIMSSITASYPTSGDTAVEVESLLWTLRDRKKYVDDTDTLLPGLFVPISGNPFFSCVGSGNNWTISQYNENDLANGDGLTSEEIAGEKLYRSVTTPLSAKRISEVYGEENKDSEQTTFYYKVKYANSPESAMTIPYHEGNTANVYLVQSGTSGGTDWVYRGDFIDTISSGNSVFEVKYVIGGYYNGDSRGKFVSAVTGTGDIYYEKYTIQSGHVDYVAMDGVDNVPVYSDYIDFDGAAKEFYSPRFNLYRTGNTANILSAVTGDMWRNGYAYDAYLAKEEYLTNFSLPPKTDVNVTIDRGGASAFEKHYKLSECNTMQDLTNYGNQYFFPE